jgi:hypothetical protein
VSRASERGADFVCLYVVIYRGAARILARHARACKSDLSTYIRAAIPDSIRDEIARKIRDCLDQPGKAK